MAMPPRPLVRQLLDWYAVEARDLPWRKTQDPYAIWVSEIMLQQTRVETVLRYYPRFLDRFPSIQALADASIDDVLKAWEGLGYYRRAHHLYRAAGVVTSKHQGKLPRTAAELRSLPGIGPYTAGAIASMAFHQDESVLDGNIIRVISRWFCIGGDSAKADTQRRLLAHADAVRPLRQAGAFNQAMMDLGARICLPRQPRCDACPVSSHCQARQADRVREFPQPRPKRSIPHVDVVAGAVWDGAPFAADSRLLIAQRHADDMLGGLWELPGGKREPGETLEEALHRELQEELGIGVEILSPFMDIQHAYTHFRITLHVFHCRHASGRPRSLDVADWTWVHPEELDRYAFPTADRRILAALTKGCTG
jgi:A/G-specific adenine glycosylase